MDEKKVQDLMRVIALCESVKSSSANPFEVDILDKIAVLRKHLPEWKFLDELLLDSEAMLELAQILKLQDEWLKHRASSLYIDPLLIQFKIKLISKDALIEAFVRSWHPLVQVDQLSPKGLEKAFVYWNDLAPMSERFKSEFGNYGVRPGTIDFDDLLQLRIFTQDQFEDRLSGLQEELLSKSKGDWVDYRGFIARETFEEKVVRAYLLAFLISEGRATMKTDALTGQIWVAPLSKKAGGTPKSVAVSIVGDD
ncbi:MAG TPA: hypothetical protein VLY21_03215 [Nitrososphaerales archaeon]|nr:hypothetical protein [Nitrososphaerales archaeon]